MLVQHQIRLTSFSYTNVYALYELKSYAECGMQAFNTAITPCGFDLN